MNMEISIICIWDQKFCGCCHYERLLSFLIKVAKTQKVFQVRQIFTWINEITVQCPPTCIMSKRLLVLMITTRLLLLFLTNLKMNKDNLVVESIGTKTWCCCDIIGTKSMQKSVGMAKLYSMQQLLFEIVPILSDHPEQFLPWS